MRTVIAACVIIASAFIGPSAWADFDFAAADLDQQQTSLNLCYAVGDSGDSFMTSAMTMTAQTFTVGKPGMWYGIEIGVIDEPIYEDVSLPVVQIGYTGLAPWTNPGSVTLSDPHPGDGWMRGVLDSPVSVTAGQMYSIILSALDQPGIVSLGATYDESYGAGALWGNDDPSASNGGTWLELSLTPPFDYPAYDMQFRTYVAVVPLPAGVLLGILGLSVAGWRLRRQMA